MNTAQLTRHDAKRLLDALERDQKSLNDEWYTASASRRREIEAELEANEYTVNRLLDSVYGGAA